jgi:hypothetical protein
VRTPGDAASIRACDSRKLSQSKLEPGYRTERIGRYTGGQFFADITGAYQEGVDPGPDWPHQQTDLRGAPPIRRKRTPHRLESLVCGRRGDSHAAVEAAERVLKGWLTALEPVTYCNIIIRPFRVDFDNVVFGLIDETTDDPDEGHGGPWAELYPQRLGFHEPWNGEYDT